MKTKTIQRLRHLVKTYESVMRVMEHDAAKSIEEDGRAYGGFVRAAKGKMQEFISEELIRTAWENELGKQPSRLSINSEKIRIPIQLKYVHQIKESAIRKYILANTQKYFYGLSVDKHVFVDKKFVIGIECKAYTENAMLKRILVDFHLLKTKFPHLLCYLFQLESQLGGDYSTVISKPKGSPSTHSLMSYFPDVELRIVSLLAGERKVDKPINKLQFFKPLTLERLENAIHILVFGFRECGLA